MFFSLNNDNEHKKAVKNCQNFHEFKLGIILEPLNLAVKSTFDINSP